MPYAIYYIQTFLTANQHIYIYIYIYDSVISLSVDVYHVLLPHTSSWILILGTDGLWDFVTDQKLLDTCISPFWSNPNLAQIIVNHALKMSQDNITVICAHATTCPSASNDLGLTQSYESSDSTE